MKNKLKDYREELGMSQVELSRRSGVARTTISYLETQKDYDVKLSTLVDIAKAIDKPVSEIFLT